MAHTAIEFAHTDYTADDAVAGALTASDEGAQFDLTQVHPADGTLVVYQTQPTLDDLQHAAKQLLPKPTSGEFMNTAHKVIGTTLKPTVKRGKKTSASQSAVWAGNLHRLVREIARSGKATARAAGKKTSATGGRKSVATRGKKTVGGREDPLYDLAGMHVNQQAPTIGVEIVPTTPNAPPEAYFAPAHCAVFREGTSCYVHVGDKLSKKAKLIGITTADGVESQRGKIFKQLQHISIVNTGLVTLLCPPARAQEFKFGDAVYIDPTTSVALRRKPEVKVATFTYMSQDDPENPTQTYQKLGRFIESCGTQGGIRVKLDIE